MDGAPTDRDKLKTRYLAAEDDELVMLMDASRTTALERAVAREVLIERGVTPPASREDDDGMASALATAEPFRPVPPPDGPRDRAGDGRRVGLLLLGIGLLVTQGLRWWAREEQSRAQWAETARAAELSQGLRDTAPVQVDPAVLEAIERGEPITIDAQGRIVVSSAPRPAPDEADVAALFEVRCLADARECMVAGRAFEVGDGVSADSARALSYFDRACEGGVEEGCDRARALREGAPAGAP